jgi:hypothetical protein
MDARPAAKASPLPMILGIVGGALLFIGSFMTWATASIDVPKFAAVLGVDPALFQGALGETSFSTSGTSGNDGIITLIAGLVVIVLAVVLYLKVDMGKVLGGLILAAGVIGAGVPLYDILTLSSKKEDALGDASGALQGAGIDPGVLNDVVKVSAGIGIWICILGGLIAIVAGIMALMRKAAAPAMTSSVGSPGTPAASGFESTSPAAPPMSTPAAPQPPAPDVTPSTPDAPSAPGMGAPSTPEPPSAPDMGGAGSGPSTP